MMTQVNFDSIGGGSSNVKTGIIEVLPTEPSSTEHEVDTGLGSNIRNFVIQGISSYYPQPNGGKNSMTAWNSETPTKYQITTTENSCYQCDIGGTVYGASPMAIKSYDGNGKFTLITGSLGASYHQGTYYWYAE